jgi:hypothetical protein
MDADAGGIGLDDYDTYSCTTGKYQYIQFCRYMDIERQTKKSFLILKSFIAVLSETCFDQIICFNFLFNFKFFSVLDHKKLGSEPLIWIRN